MDIASIVFACVTANHLGLVKAIENVSKMEIPIVNCVKCFSFWAVLSYSIIGHHEIFTSLAISFLASYFAIWLELLEGFIDTLYTKLYETIYPNTDNDTPASGAANGDPASTVS